MTRITIRKIEEGFMVLLNNNASQFTARCKALL
jgi:hypothetical protein